MAHLSHFTFKWCSTLNTNDRNKQTLSALHNSNEEKKPKTFVLGRPCASKLAICGILQRGAEDRGPCN